MRQPRNCKFCGNIISKEKKDFLKQLFNDEYKKLKADISDLIQNVENQKLKQINFNFETYAEYRERITCSVAYMNNHINTYNEFLSTLQSLLKQKYDNVEKIDFIFQEDSINLNIINAEINLLTSNIEENNDITSKFDDKQKERLKILEKLLLSKYLKEANYFKYLNELNEKAFEDKNYETRILLKLNEITALENEIRDVLKATINFNSLLHQFLGRAEIELVFDEPSKGYKLIRKENRIKAERLSDGEKAAIALIYFLTKVQENGNIIEKTIIILDDPISSLDSNNLFNAYSFIVSIFATCHQFFVLTHNFMFFSLLRRKFGKELKNDKNMYIIENRNKTINGNRLREARITAMPYVLKHLDSEYAYCFSQIVKIISADDLIDINEFFVLSNCCRKLLETFCSFKFLNKKFELDTIKNLYKIHKNEGYELSLQEKTQAEKIYKFVNYYSHGSSFSLTSEIDVIIGETKNNANDVIKLIQQADPIHYNELTEYANR